MSTTLIFDLHVHTNYSYDGRGSIEEIVESAIAKQLDGIAICDHNTMEGSYAARKYVSDNNLDLIIIPGIEVATSKGHLMVLGIEDCIKEGLSLEETIRRARQEEKDKKSTVVIIAPHPFHPFRHSIENSCLHSGIDAIEIFNSLCFFGGANKRARIMAARNGVIAVAGSDAHSAECIGLATIEVEIGQQSKQKMPVGVILRRIKEGKVKIKSRRKTPPWIYFKQFIP